MKLRQESPLTPIDILQQKFLFKKGVLKLTLNQKDLAKENFVKSLNSGAQYDARVRMECVQNLK